MTLLTNALPRRADSSPVMKTVALNHAESCRSPDDRRAGIPETAHLDLIGSGLRDIFATSSVAIPERLLALARQLDGRSVDARPAA